MSYLLNWFNYNSLWLVLMPVFLGIYVWLIIKVTLKENEWRVLCKIVFGIYFIVLLLLTVVLRDKCDTTSVCMIPFFIFTLAEKGNTVYRSVLLNVLMFIPFGLLLPDIVKKKRFQYIITVLIAIFTSIGIEIFQYIFRVGRTEIDDVIFNTIGVFIGCGIFKFVVKIDKINQKTKKW